MSWYIGSCLKSPIREVTWSESDKCIKEATKIMIGSMGKAITSLTALEFQLRVDKK